MSGPYATYEVFNRIEGFVWLGLAAFLPFRVKSKNPRQRISVLAASFGFIAFASTDFLEARTNGHLPAWLWIAKIACAAFLLSCRFTYVGWENFRFSDRYLIFALLCLAASLGIIVASEY